jgi:predicted unusual protein kinase regulating ubiquinone biosynthesis (AarF/ABC1/UbiB family)
MAEDRSDRQARPDEPEKEGKVPTGRIARTAKFGTMVAGQSARWAGTVAANRLRSEEKAEAANAARVMAFADELVVQLGQMKGAAMKVGQVLSTVDFGMIPEEERENFKARLAALRDDAPKVPFKEMRKLLEEELGDKISAVFDDFDERPIAAASIGQVYRANTTDGDDVAVKVQYPGVADAVETDIRNIGMLIPLIRRIAPGLDAKAVMAEVRERIAEELDYEIEAQNQRMVQRAFRGHPFVMVPRVYTALSTRKVLITDYVAGRDFEQVKKLPEAERDRFAEIVFRFFYGLLVRERIAAGDPHPGNYLLADDGRVCFLDFGLMRRIDPEYLDGERRLAQAVVARDAKAAHRQLASLGYFPDPDAFDPEDVLDQVTQVGEWYFTEGFRRLNPEYVRDLMETISSPRSRHFSNMRRQTVPPQALLIRRMEGMLFAVLGEMRAGGNWGRLALEYIADEEPSTPLGILEKEHYEAR